VASVLDVRARPGAAADNPPIASVRHNLAVPVLEEATVGRAGGFASAKANGSMPRGSAWPA